MKKRELKRREELYKKLEVIADKLDSYEEIYPEREIEEIQQMDIKTVNTLKQLADVFWKTDIEMYIRQLLNIEEVIKEESMLSEDDIAAALNARDMLFLLSSSRLSNKEELDCCIKSGFYNMRKESLLMALVRNRRTNHISDTYKSKVQAERNSKKINIYLNVININLLTGGKING